MRLSPIVILAPCSLDILPNDSWAESFRWKVVQNSSKRSSSSKIGRFRSRERFFSRHFELKDLFDSFSRRFSGLSYEGVDTIDIGFLSGSGPDDFDRDKERFEANFRGRSSSPLRRDVERFLSGFDSFMEIAKIHGFFKKRKLNPKISKIHNFAIPTSSSNLSAIKLG